MKNIITPEDKDHHIRAYNFRVLTKEAIEAHKNGELEAIEPKEPEPKIEQPEPETSTLVEEAAPKESSRNDEAMLAKLDELSDSVIKLQMQLEKQEAEFKERLESELALAKESAAAEAKQQAKAEYDAQIANLSASMNSACNKLTSAASAFSEFLERAQNELKDAALMIAKEVISKELASSSAQIAASYAKALIAQLDKDAQAKISVHPSDYEHVKSAVANERISVVADDAIAAGACVLNSESLNTRIDIKERFAQARALLGD